MKRAVFFPLALLLSASAAQAVTPTHPLNDTGVNLCIDTATNTFTKACKGTGQDGAYGRDVTQKDGTDGRLGFSFRKICHSGEPAGTGSCPADPVLGSAATEWGCTQDLVTGLIWEIKDGPNTLRSGAKTYTNLGDGAKRDASGFITAVNNQGLCGAKDWRLPTVTELQSIVNYGAGAKVDREWLPRTRADLYWTADLVAGVPSHAWVVDFSSGDFDYYGRDNYGSAVRLVRTGSN